MSKRNFEFCATCGGELDTGWECNSCGLDWRPLAYPWWERLKDKLKKFINKALRQENDDA